MSKVKVLCKHNDLSMDYRFINSYIERNPFSVLRFRLGAPSKGSEIFRVIKTRRSGDRETTSNSFGYMDISLMPILITLVDTSLIYHLTPDQDTAVISRIL